ncbi:MAG: tRNA (guanine(46)-N(7))-methyltransferase TrmB [Candidatus Binatia bacterium]|nr:tRNA (guanine(46)-N(7))-methyltransferase TrmB [Candidatus Binatia bacterium]
MTGIEFWEEIFGRRAAVEIEIGPGTGSFLCHVAEQHPEVNFLAIESSRSRAERLTRLLEERGLRNARVVHAAAQCVIQHCVPPGSVQAYHIYFPDPWWKRRHHKRRLFTPDFARALARSLSPGGQVYLATDVLFVWTLARNCLEQHGGLVLTYLRPPARPVRTAFEQKGLRRGAQIWEGVFALLPQLSEQAATSQEVVRIGNRPSESHP